MYSLKLKRGKIELNLECNDRDFVANQLAKIIRQASSISSFVNIPQPQPVQPQEEIKPSVEPPTPEPEQPVQMEIPTNNEPQIREPEFRHLTRDEILVASSQIPYPEHNEQAVTINSLQNPVVEQEPQVDFEQILNQESKSPENPHPITKDENYIQYVQSKSAIEKLDFLVITAQYLTKYENMSTFNLKHINGKLMHNFTLIVDHSVLQSAISKGLVTQIINNQEDQYSEYMLTDVGLRSY